MSVAVAEAAELARLVSVDDFEAAARAVLPPAAYEYYRAGAGAERTLVWNREAFGRRALWHRVLVDVAGRDLRTTVLGEPVAFPILIAPTAFHRLAHPDGELATARAAARLGTIYVASTLATVPLEAVAEIPGRRWFQLYVHRDRGLTRSLVERAAAAGYRALVLTVDTPVLGWRVGCDRQGFALPPGLGMANLTADAGASLTHVAARHDDALSWSDLAWLRSLSPLPLVLKGIVRPDDARLAVEHGAAALIVSNHGGRQLDGSPATLDALPGVVAAVAGRCEVLLDGGVRWGSDALQALALGARAVLVGRPVLWGLAAGGEAGVARVLELLRDDLDRAMALAGCPTLAAITPALLHPQGR